MKLSRYSLLRPVLVAAALLLAVLPLRAQYYSFGNEPSGIKWRQLSSPHFRLVYPASSDSLARCYLNALETECPKISEALSIEIKPIPVVLHTNTVLSNGAVSWTPKIVNLITSPDPYGPQTQPWLNELANHELRHVGQCQHFTGGMWRWLSYAIGENAPGIAMALFASSMMMEGDAVLSETLLSESGRGRNAEFLSYMRALYLQGKFPNYDPLELGSYRKMNINKYAIGYTLTATEILSKNNYFQSGQYFQMKGKNLNPVWDEFRADSLRSAPTRRSMVDRAKAIFGSMWDVDFGQRTDFTSCDTLTGVPDYYTEYATPVLVEDDLSPLYGSVISRRSGLDNAAELVAVRPSGRCEHLRWMSSYSSKLTAPSGGRIYWSELKMDGTASLESFSVIHWLDIYSLESGTIGDPHGKFFNPAVAGDSLVAAVRYRTDGVTELVLMDLAGEETAVVEAPSGFQLVEPALLGDTLYCSAVGPDGMGVLSLEPAEREPGGDETSSLFAKQNACKNELARRAGEAGNFVWTTAIKQQRAAIHDLRAGADCLYFMGDLDGVMNIYAWFPQYDALEQIVFSPYGADEPYFAADGSRLIWSSVGTDGKLLVETAVDSLASNSFRFSDRYEDKVILALTDIRDGQAAPLAAPVTEYSDAEKHPSESYSHLRHLFKFHSWAPVYYDVDRIMAMSGDHLYEFASLGAVAYSQNDLNTLTSKIGVSFHGGRVAGHLAFTAFAAGLDWELRADVGDQQRSRTYMDSEKKPLMLGGPSIKTTLLVDYPLNLYDCGWNRAFVPSLRVLYSNMQYETDEGKVYGRSKIRLGARYYKMLSTPTSSMMPRLGCSISAYAQAGLSGGGLSPASFYTSGYMYLPALRRTHGLKLSAEYEHNTRDEQLIGLSTMASLPRGENGLNAARDYLKLSLDYAFPVWLGDFTLLEFLYLQRLRVTPFTDCAFSWGLPDYQTGCRVHCSPGMDMLVDFHLFRLSFGLSAGIRYARTDAFGPGSSNYFKALFEFAL